MMARAANQRAASEKVLTEKRKFDNLWRPIKCVETMIFPRFLLVQLSCKGDRGIGQCILGDISGRVRAVLLAHMLVYILGGYAKFL